MNNKSPGPESPEVGYLSSIDPPLTVILNYYIGLIILYCIATCEDLHKSCLNNQHFAIFRI